VACKAPCGGVQGALRATTTHHDIGDLFEVTATLDGLR
jgi:hypothetical protein